MAERQAQFPDPLNSHAQPEVLPASISQQGLWFLAQLEPDSKAYNIPIGLRLRGLLRPEVLEQSLQAIINRHESLRTTFELRDRQLLQLVSTTTNFHLNITDLSDCSESQIETEAYSHAEGEVNKVFDLTRGPLFRVVVFKLRPNEHVLICMMHHIISDAWSTGVLVQELAHYYEAFSTDMDYRPKPLELQYGDYAVWQHEWSQSEAFLGQLEYWKQKLAGAPPLLDFRTTAPDPPSTDPKVGRKSWL